MNRAENKIWEAWGRTNEIADCTGLSKQTVSTVMRGLKAEGLVSLCAGKTDRREKTVQLTPEGKQYADKELAPLIRLEQRVFDVVGAERMKQMTDAITLFNLVFEKEREKRSDESNE